ncbi:hypothetical protein EJ04DRAFT_434636 [Polyplosphaeria fusca]|uniref:Uncharacterized protein n=1 Tax=Polyplosphaeria fusca TaxID=682080 RepID=A0A9P4V400_9PLEO|nr:hypothetical protein EJ04DRAFT_434636 [Polyplosphaeria fusca]
MVDIEPYSYTTFRSKPPNYMTMGLKKLDEKAWLTIDKTYFDFFAARKALLAMHPDEVIQVTPDGEEACEELLDEVVSFLTDKYPKHFDVFERDGRKYIRNRIIKEEFSLQKPYDAHPLEICARLAMEDFSILQRSEFSSQHYLVASATLFPAGWRLCERIGKSVSDLHGPVPLWKSKLSQSVEHYFSRLNDKSCMERSTFFIQIPTPKAPLADYLFVQKPQDFFSGTINRLFPEYVVIRRERQTFRRLPKSNTVVFTVKTSVQRLTDLGEEERESIIKEIEAWEPDIANYKGLPLWKRVVFGYCNGGRVSVEDDDLESDIGSLTKVSEAD